MGSLVNLWNLNFNLLLRNRLYSCGKCWHQCLLTNSNTRMAKQNLHSWYPCLRQLPLFLVFILKLSIHKDLFQSWDWILCCLFYEFVVILFDLPASPHFLQKPIYEVQDLQQDEKKDYFLPIIGEDVDYEIVFGHDEILNSFSSGGPDKFRLFLWICFHWFLHYFKIWN